jgi:phage tail-like protein
MSDWQRLGPLHAFNYAVVFTEAQLPAGVAEGRDRHLCAGAFSEVTGLEATMEPKVIKEGGRNFGVIQRQGPVTFATVVFKRGISTASDLWRWFELVAGGAYAKRLTATVTVRDPAGLDLYAWRLIRALPTKFKTADLNATAAAVGVEELHVAHEGLERVA